MAPLFVMAENLLQRQMQFQASGHTWATKRILQAARELPSEVYHGESRLFFRSIHGTLCHLLGAERLWMARLTGGDWPAAAELYDETQAPTHVSHTADKWEALEPSLSSLADAMEAQCASWERLASEWDDAALISAVRYRSTEGAETACVRVAGLTQVFAHAAHHRGQVSAALSAMRRLAPALDLQCQGAGFFGWAPAS